MVIVKQVVVTVPDMEFQVPKIDRIIGMELCRSNSRKKQLSSATTSRGCGGFRWAKCHLHLGEVQITHSGAAVVERLDQGTNLLDSLRKQEAQVSTNMCEPSNILQTTLLG